MQDEKAWGLVLCMHSTARARELILLLGVACAHARPAYSRCRGPLVVVATTLLPPTGAAPLFYVGSAEEEGGEYE